MVIRTLFITSLLCSINASMASKDEVSQVTIEDVVQDLCDAVVNIVDLDDYHPTSLGSGFIVSDDGYIVTNNHVLGEENVTKVNVILYDGTKLSAKVIGRDSRVDIALLQVSAGKKLKFLKFGDSDKIRVCQPVIAIGNPFGFDNTVTSGIISRKSRNISNSIRQIGGGDLVDYIQTDASINNGNSGGPLILSTTKNLGEVIGMNTSMFSDSEVSSGINFAIPSNLIKSVVKQLKEYGKIKRAWLGVSFVQLQPDVLTALKIKNYTNAVMVTKVDNESPASRAGIKPNDVILSINQLDLLHQNRANMIVSSLEVGSVIDVGILREDKKTTIKIRVGYKEQEEHSNPSLLDDLKKLDGVYAKELGMTVANLNYDLVSKLSIPYNQHGVVISDISGLVSNQHDINIGDVIMSINLKPITDTNALEKYIAEQKSSQNTTVALYIKRGNESFFRVIPIRRVK